MNKYKLLLEKNNLKVNKVTIQGKVTIIDTPLGKFVLRDNKGNKIYEYLKSRGFTYFPNIIDYDNEGILFEYINNIDYDKEEKEQDYIKLLSLLHVKTVHFVDINNDIDDIYNKYNMEIDDLNNYYNNIASIIENKEYMSPSEYLLIRNISIILSSLSFSKYKIKEWYKKYKNITKKRVVTLYNNASIDNLIKGEDKTCFTNFDNSFVGNPIYDLLLFYNNYYLSLDFNHLLKIYEKCFLLLEEEQDLLIILMSIPDKIIINNDINNIKSIKNSISKCYKTLDFLNFKEKEQTNKEENKNNK